MKRTGNIYEKICDMDNLREAHKNARKDKAYYVEVKMVNADPDFYLNEIRVMLKNKKYEVSEYTHKYINDSGKERHLMKLPYYPDRIIQWAIMLQIENVFHQVFTDFTCASLRGRGIHYASNLLDKYMEFEFDTRYCLKFDISHFYDSINHDILKRLLRRKFKDPDLLELIYKIIDSVPGGVGIPIGSYLSQYLANFYLSYFDHWLKEECGVRYVIRYMDDVVILHYSKDWLHDLRIRLEKYLNCELDLKLKKNWQVFPTAIRGIDFIGYRHFYGYKLLRKRTCKHFKRHALKIKKMSESGEMISYGQWCATNSYKGWLKWCNSYRLSRKYIDPIQSSVDDYYMTQIKKKEVTK